MVSSAEEALGSAETKPARSAGRRFVESAAQAEPADDVLVAGYVGRLEVIEQFAPLRHEFEQAAARSMVGLVQREVLAEIVDACGEQRDLDLGDVDREQVRDDVVASWDQV